MGGTRCVFRDCQVSTQRNPKMHFFKLPVKDTARLEVWLKNCGNAEILNVAREKLINRAVCARHFRYECFMNYKLDRLIPKQIPTLARISKELAWDLAHLDENGEATMVKLTIPTEPHLIPPQNFECPLGFTEDARFGRKYSGRRSTPPRPLPLDEIKRQKIEVTEVIEKTECVEGLAPIMTFETAIKPEKPDIMDTSSLPSMSDDIVKQLQLKYDQLKSNFDQLSAANVALKESMLKLKAEQEASKTNTAAGSFTAPQTSSKSQLYNGIKKYLGPSMAALVRMEMFGGGEREWKEDEREFTKELLQLGDNVYTHCCDEWRFRLPSLRVARSWLETTSSAEDGGENL